MKTSVLWHGCMCTGFKVEPQDRMEKVYSEIDTLWQVHSHTYCLRFVFLPYPQGCCSTVVFQSSFCNFPAAALILRVQTALARQDLPCTHLAGHKVESVLNVTVLLTADRATFGSHT